MHEAFIDWAPRGESLAVVEQANAICREYRGDGYDLTLRQLYYQFVARGLIPNNQRSYKRLGDLVNKGRLAGLIDWGYIVDRTRSMKGGGGWGSPATAVRSVCDWYTIDWWQGQDSIVEVWVEKEALAGVVQRAAHQWGIPYFSCRGYVSQSELYEAGKRHQRRRERQHMETVVLHLGDHDPSGLDMTRDIKDRLYMFSEHDTDVRRIALNMDQVEQYNPPPNPAKLTDSRVDAYMAEYGDESWELDALEPRVLVDLIDQHVRTVVDLDRWQARRDLEEDQKVELAALADNYPEVVDHLRTQELL